MCGKAGLSDKWMMENGRVIGSLKSILKNSKSKIYLSLVWCVYCSLSLENVAQATCLWKFTMNVVYRRLKSSTVKKAVCFKLKQTKSIIKLLWYSKGSTRIEFLGNKKCFLIHLFGHGSCHGNWYMTVFTVLKKPSDWTWKAWNQEMWPRFLGLT